MEAKTVHTATPWIVCTPSDSEDYLSIEQDAERLQDRDSEPSIIASVDLSGVGIDREDGEANAAFIVRACNRDHLFDEMVALLKDRPYIGGSDGREWNDRVNAALAAAEQA